MLLTDVKAFITKRDEFAVIPNTIYVRLVPQNPTKDVYLELEEVRELLEEMDLMQ